MGDFVVPVAWALGIFSTLVLALMLWAEKQSGPWVCPECKRLIPNNTGICACGWRNKPELR